MATDISGLDPLTVSLRDYIDGANTLHEGTHARERESLAAALTQHDKLAEIVISDHFKSHDSEHQAVRTAFENYLREIDGYKHDHSDIHEKDRLAVKTALDAVDRLAALHSSAHEREHVSHETVHQREREAAGLARVDLDNRLNALSDQRQLLREQQGTFMPRTEVMALIERISANSEQANKASDAAHTRMDNATSDRFTAVQTQIDKLNIAAAANSGASQRTVFLFGSGLTFITVVIAIVTLYLGSRH